MDTVVFLVLKVDLKIVYFTFFLMLLSFFCTVVNRSCYFMNGESLEITGTVPLMISNCYVQILYSPFNNI